MTNLEKVQEALRNGNAWSISLFRDLDKKEMLLILMEFAYALSIMSEYASEFEKRNISNIVAENIFLATE